MDEFSPENDGYWVGLVAEEDEEIPNEMLSLTIPPQRYGIIRHEGPNHLIRGSYEELKKGLGDTGCIRRKEKWHLEKYYSWKDTQKIIVELWDKTSGI